MIHKGHQASFQTANIDRAIVLTQFDLRGFSHPLGFRMMAKIDKNLDAATHNFMAFAAGRDGTNLGTDADYADYCESSYEEYLAMAKRLVNSCSHCQIEAIKLLIKDMIDYNKQLWADIESGKEKQSHYSFKLSSDNRWGKAVLALKEAFDAAPEMESIAA